MKSTRTGLNDKRVKANFVLRLKSEISEIFWSLEIIYKTVSWISELSKVFFPKTYDRLHAALIPMAWCFFILCQLESKPLKKS